MNLGYDWSLTDLKNVKPNDYKVFGTFICGGGSSMGYKRQGFTHLGGVEIDPKVAEVYKANHNPKYIFSEDIRTFKNRTDIPVELLDLDILDGSPPCSSFSLAGSREKDWGKEKVFREGQKLQTLDGLFMDFLDVAELLRPKVIIAENVRGMVSGKARPYVRLVADRFRSIGYTLQIFLLNGASMGLPQKRESVFFIAHKSEFRLPKIDLAFNEPLVTMRDIIDFTNTENTLTDYQKSLWNLRIPSDKSFGDVIERTEGGRLSMFTNPLIHSDDAAPTITSGMSVNSLYDLPRALTTTETILASSFPRDYNFLNVKPLWLMGMSVPPLMMDRISEQIKIQWLDVL